MKKRKIKKNIKLAIISILIITIFLVFIYFCKNITENKFISQNIIEVNKKYSLKVEYPLINHANIDKTIKKMIDSEIKNFKNESKENKEDYPYDLLISYTTDEMGEIYSLHFTIFSFTGGAHYTRRDRTYYYNKNTGKEMNQEQFFKDYNKALEKISALAYSNLKQNNDDLFEDDVIKFNLKPIKGNFSNMLFMSDGISIIFPPYQVAPWSSGEKTVFIPYKDIKDYINFKTTQKEEKPQEELKPSNKRDLSLIKDKKLIALTFDDGPNGDTTTRLLDGLKERDARATFFMLGSRVSKYPDIVTRIYEEGHSVASHTYNHKNLTYLNEIDVSAEINDTNNIIENIIGLKPNLLRPPYGSYNDTILGNSGMTFVMWNVDPKDWQYRNTETVYNHIISNTESGDIILLHDLYDTSIDAALKVIDTLKADGYEFVSIDELLEIKGDKLLAGDIYFSFK